jgi:hypothetical protein
MREEKADAIVKYEGPPSSCLCAKAAAAGDACLAMFCASVGEVHHAPGAIYDAIYDGRMNNPGCSRLRVYEIKAVF